MSLSDLVSLVCMPRTGIAGSYGSSISWCSLFKSLYWIGYNITSVLLFSFLAAKQSMWDFSSLTRDHTCTPSVEGVCVCVCVKVTQSFPTLCDSINCSPPASSVHGILQARILEWVAMPSSRGSSQLRDQTWVSCIVGRFFTDWSTREAVEGEDLQIIFFDIQINLLLKVCKFFYFLNLN